MSDITLILKAATFAAHKHRDQRRKDVKATPYINHPLALAQALCEEGAVDDPVILAAALLHDTIEDTETSYDELRGQFGARIADIVAEVTDTKFLGKQSRKRLQLSKAGRASAAAQQVNSGHAARRRSGRRSASTSTSTGRRRWWTRSGARIRGWRSGLMRCGRRGGMWFEAVRRKLLIYIRK